MACAPGRRHEDLPPTRAENTRRCKSSDKTRYATATSHSPASQQIERVRVVEDRGDDVGSVTFSDALEVGEDSAFPLQAALGSDLSQNLFIGEQNLLVEGPSDLAYLNVIGRHLRDQGRSTSAGGSSKPEGRRTCPRSSPCSGRRCP